MSPKAPPNAPPVPPLAAAVPAPVTSKSNTLWLESSELEPVAVKRNTLWLDSEELLPVTGNPTEATPQAAPEPVAAKRNTLWLDSEELVPVPAIRNTLWLDSTELTEVAPEPEPSTPAAPAPAASDQHASSEAQSPATAIAGAKGKRLKGHPGSYASHAELPTRQVIAPRRERKTRALRASTRQPTP